MQLHLLTLINYWPIYTLDKWIIMNKLLLCILIISTILDKNLRLDLLAELVPFYKIIPDLEVHLFECNAHFQPIPPNTSFVMSVVCGITQPIRNGVNKGLVNTYECSLAYGNLLRSGSNNEVLHARRPSRSRLFRLAIPSKSLCNI